MIRMVEVERKRKGWASLYGSIPVGYIPAVGQRNRV